MSSEWRRNQTLTGSQSSNIKNGTLMNLVKTSRFALVSLERPPLRRHRCRAKALAPSNAAATQATTHATTQKTTTTIAKTATWTTPATARRTQSVLSPRPPCHQRRQTRQNDFRRRRRVASPPDWRKTRGRKRKPRGCPGAGASAQGRAGCRPFRYAMKGGGRGRVSTRGRHHKTPPMVRQILPPLCHSLRRACGSRW